MYIKVPSTNKTCTMCGKVFQSNINWAKYCCRGCRKKFYAERYFARPVSLNFLSPSVVGSIHELMVCVDLVKKGLQVFKNVCSSGKTDLVATNEGKFIRIEVTTGFLMNNGKLQYPPKKNHEFDLLAVCTHKGEIFYSPALNTLITVDG